MLDLECDHGPAQLVVESSPAPPGDGLRIGQALRITTIRAPGEAGEIDTWLRVESDTGRLLLAAVAATTLDPPDASPWASPFSVAEAASACMTEEAACGASLRTAVDLRLSGGAPLRLYDGTAAAVGDPGEFVVRVAAARTAPTGSACRPNWQLGLLATR